MPDCIVFPTEPQWEDFFRAAARPLSADWFGSPLPFSFSFAFGISPAMFYFGAFGNCSASSKAGTKRGDFSEGLWESDVVELFLADDDTEAYQEFNLAPNGAWWTKRFSRYRTPDEGTPDATPEIFSVSGANDFQVGFRMRRDALLVVNRFGPASRANLSAILGGKDRLYFGVHTAPETKPDFHLQSVFSPFVLTPVGR